MKECPNCHEKTIPMDWILFHQILKKNCNFYECPSCKKNIRTGHLFNFSVIYTPFTDIIMTPILLFILYIAYGFINSILLILSFLVGYTILFLMQQYFVPLELSIETKCEEKGLTKIQAFFSLILIILIISFTVYSLLIKPLILNEPIFT
ncbi:hypothetical protein [Arcobacter sp.]|uniref:hypothetical protein n=1 Tax=Arcobacter sp. TaxID=1872629 RepID=UPI003C79384E